MPVSGKKVLEKRLRMVLDFEVEVEELTEEGLHEHYRQSENYEELVGDGGWWENAKRQIGLQRTLLEDEGALGKFLTLVVTTELDGSVESRLAEVFGVGGDRTEEDILEPLFSRLSEEDERFYRGVSEEGILFDNTEPLSRSFKGRWTRATLEEIQAVTEGAVDD
jgi:hypothetical protein